MSQARFDDDPPQSNFLDRVPVAARKGEYELPSDARIDRCKSCDAQIVWTYLPSGKAMPLSLATVQTRGGKKYCLSHFADCPHGKEWSTKKARPS